MTFTRKSIADHLDSYDAEITALQDSKRDMLNDYRQQLADKGFGKAAIKDEIDGLKVAMRRRRAIAKKGAEEIEQADAIADEIFLEITSASRAPRATREIIEEFPPHDAETGELTDNQTSGRNGPAATGSTTDEAETSSAPVTHSHSSDPLRSNTAGEAPSSNLPASPATIPHLRPSSQAAGSPASDAAPSEAGATTAAASRSSSMTAREIDATIPAFLRRTEGGYPKREEGAV